ncbi:MAG: PAS domain S-box protein [Planctomycetota bacterium]|jgi:two-component system sensor kinase FixL
MTDHPLQPSDSHVLFTLYEEDSGAFEQLPAGVLTIFPERACKLRWNSRFAAIWQLPLDQNDSAGRISFADLENHCAQRTPEGSEFQLVPDHFSLDGAEDTFRDTIFLNDGRIVHRSVGVAENSATKALHCIYEEYPAQQADLLRLQEWNDTFDAMPDHICLLDLSGAIVRANRTMRERFEPVHGQLKGLDYRLVYCGTATPDPQPPCAQVLAGGPPVDIETQLPTMEGWYRVASTPVSDALGRQWGAISTVADITDQVQIRDQATEQQKQLQELVQSSLDGIIFCDEYGMVSLWNRQAEHILGWTAEEAIGRRLDQLIVPESAVDQHKQGMARFRREKSGPLIGQRTEVLARHKDGHLVDVEISISAVEVSGRMFVCGSIHDITKRIKTQKELVRHRDHLQQLVEERTRELQATVKRLEQEILVRQQTGTALRNSEERLSSVVANVPESILLISEDGRILFANQPPPSSRITDVTGRLCHELWPPDTSQELQETLARAKSQPAQRCIVISTDEASIDCVVELSIRPVTVHQGETEFVLVFRDITAERDQQRERERAGTVQAHLSRLSALGEMASNISHEINQPLTAVANLASAARRGVRKLEGIPQAIEEILGEIIDEAQRAGDIVHRLRDFARRRPVERTQLILRESVESALTLTSNELSVYQVGVTTNVADDICIFGDAIHLQQILVNLLLNAVQAIDADRSGQRHIWIEADVRDFTVSLTVRDTGPGFADTLTSNPLEAYVTTKPQGTGLGLSICHSLVELNEGTLTIGNSPEGGALITITLPATSCATRASQPRQ